MLARLGTMLGDLEPVAPQEAFLNRLEDLLVARANVHGFSDTAGPADISP